jgi:twitching motility protein PilT
MQRAQLDEIIREMIDLYPDASDINFTVGRPPQVEINGILHPVELSHSITQLTPFQTERIALLIVGRNPRLLRELVLHGSCDASYQISDKTRFRVNVFSQKGHYSIVMRRLPAHVPTIESLGLPQILKEIAREKTGLVLVTGATGMGKTTTLASILDEINEEKAVHIVTLEDPIEYVHVHKKATFNQRELGVDFDTFPNGLRAALRQAPKVILVGEMRDRETLEVGLMAAETGHLVLSTLHTINAGSTINRIVGMFPLEEEHQVRIRLADSLKWVISQRLLPSVDGSRVAAFEIMGMSPRVKETIINGEAEGRTFYEIIEDAKAFGWMTLEQSILGLFERGLITEETAILYAEKRSIVRRGVDFIKAKRGESISELVGLSLDLEYEKGVKRVVNRDGAEGRY